MRRCACSPAAAADPPSRWQSADLNVHTHAWRLAATDAAAGCAARSSRAARYILHRAIVRGSRWSTRDA